MKQISMKELKKAGAFVGAPVEREIKWTQDGKEMTFTTYVRKLSYKSAMADVHSFDDPDSILAGRIAACICDANGKPILTVDDITGDKDPQRGPLNHNLTAAFMAAIAEVNSLGKQEA